MDPRPDRMQADAQLRGRAEARLAGQAAGEGRGPGDELELRRLELDLQGEDLAAQGVELAAARARAQDLGRLFLALSQAHRAMRRVRDEQELFQKICEISCGFGDFVLAWIGIDEPSGRELRIVARSGPAQGYLEGLQLLRGQGLPFDQGPTATAMRLGRPVTVDDFQTDPYMRPWAARAAQFGLGSDATFPIHRSGRAVGAMTVYAGQPRYFDAEKLALLGEIVDGLSYALDDLDREATVRKISVAVEQSPVTVVITDAAGVIEYVNPKFTELTGYSAAEALGQNPRILKAGGAPPGTYRELWSTIKAGAIWKGEFHNRKKDGELFWEAATIAPIKNPDGVISHFVAIKEDITGRREAKLQLEQLNGDLERRVQERTALLEQANAELDAFSYSVSHDLRAPLRSIDGFSQIVLEECGGQLSEDGRHYLERVRAGTQRMGRLIDDLLELSRVGRGAINGQRLDLSAMAWTLLQEFRQADPGRNLTFQMAPGLTAWGDPGLLRSVLANLLGNAWKYTAKVPAGSIGFGLEPQPDGGTAFCVRDNGAGFDMAYAGKLFAPFQRLHSATDFEGSGIGLALVQRIIHRHGGRVWAWGEVGRGACFCFTLPDRS